MKVRTPESRSAEAAKLRERSRRGKPDPLNPKVRGEPVKVLSAAERGGVKADAPKAAPKKADADPAKE